MSAATVIDTIVAAGLRLATEKPDFDPNSVTPGVEGFVAIALLAIAVLLIGLDMNRRVRRTRYRTEVREKLAAERGETPEAGETAAPGEAPEGSRSPR